MNRMMATKKKHNDDEEDSNNNCNGNIETAQVAILLSSKITTLVTVVPFFSFVFDAKERSRN